MEVLLIIVVNALAASWEDDFESQRIAQGCPTRKTGGHMIENRYETK
jgi:hypothetical protein